MSNIKGVDLGESGEPSKFSIFRYGDTVLGKIVDKVFGLIEDVFYYNPISLYGKVSRSLAYAKIGWGSYDWDGNYLLELMQFKLKRMKISLLKGYGSCNEYNEMKALDLLIKIGDRVVEEKYFRFSDLHDKKWGKLIVTHTPVKMGTMSGSTVHFSRPKANTEEEILLEYKEQVEAYHADNREKDRDRKIYFAILNKYLPFFWD